MEGRESWERRGNRKGGKNRRGRKGGRREKKKGEKKDEAKGVRGRKEGEEKEEEEERRKKGDEKESWEGGIKRESIHSTNLKLPPCIGTSDPGQKKTPVLSPFLAAVTHICITDDCACSTLLWTDICNQYIAQPHSQAFGTGT